MRCAPRPPRVAPPCVLRCVRPAAAYSQVVKPQRPSGSPRRDRPPPPECRDELLRKPPREALELVQRDKRLSRNIFAHNQVLHRLVSAGERDLALRHLTELEQSGLGLLPSTYTTLISDAARRGDVVEAEGLYRRMEEHHIAPDPITTSALINAHARAGNLEAAQQLLTSAPHVTEAGYGSVVQALVRAGRRGEAAAVLAQMRARGVRSPVAHTLLAKALLKSGEVDAFEALLGEAQRAREALGGDVFLTLLTECAAKRLPLSLEGAVALLQRKGVAVGKAEMHAAISGHIQANDLAEAEKRLAEMSTLLNEKPRADTFASAITVLRMWRRFEGVLRWAELMEAAGVGGDANSAVCHTIAEAARRLGRGDEERKWTEREKAAAEREKAKVAAGAAAEPGRKAVAAKSALMSALEREARRGPLLRGLNMLRTSKEAAGADEWDFVVANLIDSAYPDLAANVMRAMREAGVAPTIALSRRLTTARVRHEAKSGHVRKADELLREASADGVELEAEAVLAVATAHAKRREAEEAQAVFRLLPSPDTTAYVTMTKLMIGMRKYVEARQLWAEFVRTGLEETEESRALGERFKVT